MLNNFEFPWLTNWTCVDQKEDFAKVQENLLINMTANVVHALLAKTGCANYYFPISLLF